MRKTKIGICSCCGSDSVEYGQTELDSNSLGYHITCNDCLAKGIEWYDVIYSETIMEKNN